MGKTCQTFGVGVLGRLAFIHLDLFRDSYVSSSSVAINTLNKLPGSPLKLEMCVHQQFNRPRQHFLSHFFLWIHHLFLITFWLTELIIGTLAGGWKAHVGRKLPDLHFILKGSYNSNRSWCLKCVSSCFSSTVVAISAINRFSMLFDPGTGEGHSKTFCLCLFRMFFFLFTDGVYLFPEYDGMKCWNFIPLCFLEIISASIYLNICIKTFWPEVPTHLLTSIYTLWFLNLYYYFLPLFFFSWVLDSVSATDVSSSKLAVAQHRSRGCCTHRAGKPQTGPFSRARIELE